MKRVLPYPILCFAALAYLMPGILGHDPWKQDETYTFGIIYHMLTSGEWGVPVNAGQPFMEKPPLYAWAATVFARLFSPWLPLHDGARLTSAFFSALTLAFTAHSARLCLAADSWRATDVIGIVAIFAGSIGVLKHSHDLFTDVGLMCGAALGMYGLLRLAYAVHTASRRTHIWIGALHFGVGVGLCWMTKGVFVPLVFGATALLIPVALDTCRNNRYACALLLALIASAPFALIWPLWLAQHDWPLFMSWFWDNNVGRFFGFSLDQLGAENDEPFYFLYVLWGFAFPAAPLAAAGLALGGWKQWREPRIAIPLIYAGIGIAVLCVSASARQLYLLPFVLPLALLAIEGVRRIPMAWHSVWDWLNRFIFSLAALLAWAIWWTMRQPIHQHSWLSWLEAWLPLDYVLPFQPWALIGAVLLTVAWGWALSLFKAQREWRGVFSGCGGAILVWGLVYTLLLPWLNQAKSYGPVFTTLAQQLKPIWQSSDCMASERLGESEAPMLQYFAGVLHQPIADPSQSPCRWLIMQGQSSAPYMPHGAWRLFWRGARQGDKVELLRVFKKIETPIE